MSKEQIFEKAKELGEIIKHSELRKRADEAGKALTADETAVDLINAYNEKRQEKLAAFSEKQPTAEEAKELNEYLQAEFNKIIENPIIKEYIEASSEFDSVLNQMDQIIKSAVSGGQGCSGSCSTCGGCH